MKLKLIVPLFILSALLQACPSEACLKKIRTLIRNKVKQDKPAELHPDESSFIKYSHAADANFYIEIVQDEKKKIIVRELDYPPIAMSQVAEGEFEAKTTEIGKPLTMPNTMFPATTEMIQPSDPPPMSEKGTATIKGQKGEEEIEEILSPEDQSVRNEWGGNCTSKDWNRCNKIRQIVVLDVIKNQFQHKNLELDCLLQPILCLKNGWTANRCHILCMAAQCNKQIYFNWDDTVDFEGPCRYRK